VVLTLLSVACAGKAGSDSPWHGGVDLRFAPGIEVSPDSTVTVHPTVAFARTLVGGVDGEQDSFWNFGGQIRTRLPNCSSAGRCPWFGGETTFARRTTSFDAPGVESEVRNGWTVAGLGGIPLVSGKAGTLHGYAAGGLSKFGGTGPYIRVGFDFQPAFLRK